MPGEIAVLDVGCGLRKQEPCAVGIDRSPQSAADIVWDLDKVPWPLPDGTFTRVYMSHIIEHVQDVMATMNEVHRVCKAGADVYVVTPHFSSHNSYSDPTHLRHLAVSSFQHFSGSGFPGHSAGSERFDVVSAGVTFGSNAVLDSLARLVCWISLRWYERRVAWVLPACDIRAHLRVVK